ncbi:MAG: integrin [Gammaproteobacteria bacterium]|nr:integrin [Gammaproteobacteria bacterium]
MFYRYLVVVVIAVALGGCANGVENSNKNDPPVLPKANDPPAVPNLNVSASLKQLHFAWTAVDHATYYKLSQNADGHSGYTQVGGNLTATSAVVDIVVHRFDWPNARYMVEACNAIGCAASSPVSVATAMLQSIGYVKASNSGVSDRFGRALALSGDGNTLAIGAWIEASASSGIDANQQDDSAPEAGAVYVFARSGDGWKQQAYIKASNAGAGDHFGIALALSRDGNTLVVGAPEEDSAATGIDNNPNDECSVAIPVNCATDSGAAYVYRRSGATWAEQAYLKASNTGAGDHFGAALGLSRDGNILAVGAYGEDSNATDQLNDTAPDAGAVYIFVRSDTAWAQQAYIKASNTESGDAFGFSLALSGDGATLAVGAYQEDGIIGDPSSNVLVDSGAVYVYTRSGSTWSVPIYVKASNPGTSDQFGFAVALSSDGNTLAVGAHLEDSAATGVGGSPLDDCLVVSPIYCAADSGAVYVYTRSDSGWTQQAYLKASNSEAGDWFGFAVALNDDGSVLTVGAIFEDSIANGMDGDSSNNAELDSGAVYMFVCRVGMWIQQAYIKALNPGTDDRFGVTLGLSGDGATLVVGAPREDSSATGLGGDQTNDATEWAGAAYIY